MKGLTIISILLICLTQVLGQEYFIAGTEALQNSEFQEADSLFSISYEKLETSQALFNRAIARMGLEDFEGSCSDFLIMSDIFNDEESANFYNLQCCLAVDTTYFDSKYKLANSNEFKYYKIQRIHKFSNDTTTTYHKRKGKYGGHAIMGSGSGFGLVEVKKNDIYGRSYTLNGNEVYIQLYNKYPECRSYEEMYDFKQATSTHLKAKYPQIRRANNSTEISLHVKLILNPDGEVLYVKAYGFSNELDLGDRQQDFAEDLDEIFEKLPPFRPVTYNKEAIYFQFQIEIDF